VKIFQKILLPLCGVNDFVILGISTPQDETNYYSRLLDLKDDEGKPFFVGLRIEQACAACIQNNKADSCDHRLYLLPPWKGGQRHRRMAAIYENDKTTFAQENQGVIINASKTYIFRDFHKAFVGNPPYLFDKRPSVIWVAIDPSGGGCQSQYAMVALVVEGHHHVIVGADSCPSHSSVTINRFLKHFIGSLRNHAQYSGALLCYFIESNMSYIDADRVRLLLTADEFQPAMSIDKDPKKLGRAGVFTTETEKAIFADDLGNLLRRNDLRVAQDRIDKFDQEVKADPYAMLADQIRTYRKEMKIPNEPCWGKVHVTYTGKSPGVVDDLIMALQIAVTNIRRQREDPEFVKLARSQGWDLT
jgi:hypothetical protein